MRLVVCQLLPMRAPIGIASALGLAAPASASVPLWGSDLPTLLFDAQLAADSAVTSSLAELTPTSALVLYAAGLLTSLTPCCLSMLPFTFAYLGGLSGEGSGLLLARVLFVAGLATTFAGLGVAASSLGLVYGESATGSLGSLRVAASAISVVMGANLLQLLPLTFPTLQPTALGAQARVPLGAAGAAARAFLFGASSALVASPCASPVLATLLSFVATLADPLLGGGLLLCYTAGYTTPVAAAALALSQADSESTGQVPEDGGSTRLALGRAQFGWVAPASGSCLLGLGTYNLLVAAFGPV
jgi:cytochrome c-type biogenesis protein